MGTASPVATATRPGPSPFFSPHGEAKCMRGPSVRGARRLTSGGVLEQYGEHGEQAQRSNGGSLVCFARQVVRKAGKPKVETSSQLVSRPSTSTSKGPGSQWRGSPGLPFPRPASIQVSGRPPETNTQESVTHTPAARTPATLRRRRPPQLLLHRQIRRPEKAGLIPQFSLVDECVRFAIRHRAVLDLVEHRGRE